MTRETFDRLIREGIPNKAPIQPTVLEQDSTIQFHCHPGVACFNACCKSIEIQITPYDIIRLKNHLELDSADFVARYTLPYAMDGQGMPGLHLATKPGSTECIFLSPEGCSVYQDRPAACRYYALGVMGMRKQEESTVEDIYFLVKEDHCRGHDEPQIQTIAAYRAAQGVVAYDEANREWRDIVIKKRTSGPTIGQPSARSMQLFDLCSYDLDNFRLFIQSEGFQDGFDVSVEKMQLLLDDEAQLLQFAFRFLKQALFAEMTIPLKPQARERRLKRRQQAKLDLPQGKDSSRGIDPL
ncbi:MAG TPA: YkgJ family cysteine cluster protein [Gammaproteobacteria bacterium]|nr:YkgJ family cysteine cluster protein [Gammaproteobacteria bacterium]